MVSFSRSVWKKLHRAEKIYTGSARGARDNYEVWVMVEWLVGQWIVDVVSFQKIFGLYGLKHHIVEISGDVTDAGRDNK